MYRLNFPARTRIISPCTAAILIVAFCVLWPGPAAALPPGNYTESEKAGFAFHQMSKTNPDFEKWIGEIPAYQQARPAEKVELMRKEKTRLNNGFINFQPDVDLVRIGIEAKLQASQYFGASQKNQTDTDVSMELVDLPDNYFPFYIGGMWIAVIIKDYDYYTNFSFSAESYKDFAGKSGLNAVYQRSRPVKVDLALRPVSVDMSAPVVMDGLEMWLMLAEVGQMTVWRQVGGKRNEIYNFDAPWYTSPTHWDLLRLYEE